MIFNMIGGGGDEFYSLLTVTTTEASLVGQNVVVTATGTGAETESYTQVFTAAKSLVFKLKQLTTYTITCGTATQTIAIPYYSDYTAAIASDKKLYTNGTENVPWTVDGKGSSKAATYLVYDKENDSGYTVRTVMTSGKIDTTGFAKLRVKATVVTASGTNSPNLRFGLYNDMAYGSYTDNCFNLDPKGGTLVVGENDVELDLSNYQGEYYIGICSRTYTTARHIKVHFSEIWLE